MSNTSYKTTRLLTLGLLLSLFAGLQACQDSGTNFYEPDYSQVPAPFDISQADTTIEREDGLVIHIIEQATNTLPAVTSRDQVSVRYTGRTDDGTVIASSYANGSTSPTRFNNLTPFNSSSASSLIEGFREGIIGMKIGERRTVIIPPSLGYGNTVEGQQGYNLRDETLVYDIELVDIR